MTAVSYIGPHDAVDVTVPEGAPCLPTGGTVTVAREVELLDTTPEHAAELLAQKGNWAANGGVKKTRAKKPADDASAVAQEEVPDGSDR